MCLKYFTYLYFYLLLILANAANTKLIKHWIFWDNKGLSYLILSYPFLSLNLNGCLWGTGVVYFEITDV